MGRAGRVLAIALLGGCAGPEVLRRPATVPGVAVSMVEAPAGCRPLEAVEVRAGRSDPIAHALLRAFAVERGANYVVVDAFGVVADEDEVFAVARARLFACPVTLARYHRGAAR